MKLWLVVGGGSKVMAGSGCWQQNYGWLWVVVGGCGWLQDLVMPVAKTQFF